MCHCPPSTALGPPPAVGPLQHGQMPFKLIALVLPLSLDTFAVSAALGVAGLSKRERWRLSLVLAGFEAVMPIVGFLAGGLLGLQAAAPCRRGTPARPGR